MSSWVKKNFQKKAGLHVVKCKRFLGSSTAFPTWMSPLLSTLPPINSNDVDGFSQSSIILPQHPLRVNASANVFCVPLTCQVPNLKSRNSEIHLNNPDIDVIFAVSGGITR